MKRIILVLLLIFPCTAIAADFADTDKIVLWDTSYYWETVSDFKTWLGAQFYTEAEIDDALAGKQPLNLNLTSIADNDIYPNLINDSGTDGNTVWSAAKIIAYVAANGGTQQGTLSFSPTSWSPADAAQGTATASQTFTITATGGPVTFSSFALGGSNYFADAGTGTCGQTEVLAEDGSCTIDIEFAYTLEGGPYSDTLTVNSSATDDPNTASLGPVTVSAIASYDILVDPGGTGDYTSLSAAIASLSGGIPSTPYVIECISTNGDADTTAVTIPNTLTGASAVGDLVIQGGEGNTASTSFSDTKYRLRATSGAALTLNMPYVTIKNLQLELEDTSGYGSAIIAGNAGYVSDILIDSCYLNGNSQRGTLLKIDGATGSDIDIRNSIIGHLGAGSSSNNIAVLANTPNINLFNNTIVDNSQAHSLYFVATGGNGNITNNIFANVPQPSSSSLIYSYNAFDTGETVGTNAVEVADWTAEFTNQASEYSLLSGATIRGGGTDLSGTFTTDIEGDVRVAWDIGADEY